MTNNGGRIASQAAALLAVLGDGRPHSNAEIGNRTGWRWNHPHWGRVRKYLRDRGYSFVYDSGYWQMTDNALLIRNDDLRRIKPLYSECVSRARSKAGAYARNPNDMAVEYEMKASQTVAFTLGVRLGFSPAAIAEDLQVVVE
jgi:hypothetical protein